MNNMQHIIANDTRAAMHMAVELCEQGDFDSVSEAFRWLLQERDDAALGGGECEWELEHSGTLYDKWRCSECKFLFVEPRCDQGYMDLVPNYCPNCGRKVK